MSPIECPFGSKQPGFNGQDFRRQQQQIVNWFFKISFPKNANLIFMLRIRDDATVVVYTSIPL